MHENYEFLNVLSSKSASSSSSNSKCRKQSRNHHSTEYIDLRETTHKKKNNYYGALSSFESLKKKPAETNYDFLTGCESSTKPSPYSGIARHSSGAGDSQESHYDILMTYKSSKNAPNDIYVNLSEKSSESRVTTPKVSLYKVVKEYVADFKGDLSVCKGDLVYLVETSGKATLSSDWVCARLYKRTRCGTTEKVVSATQKNVYENVSEITSHLLQGYIPRAHLVKV